MFVFVHITKYLFTSHPKTIVTVSIRIISAGTWSGVDYTELVIFTDWILNFLVYALILWYVLYSTTVNSKIELHPI